MLNPFQRNNLLWLFTYVTQDLPCTVVMAQNKIVNFLRKTFQCNRKKALNFIQFKCKWNGDEMERKCFLECKMA